MREEKYYSGSVKINHIAKQAVHYYEFYKKVNGQDWLYFATVEARDDKYYGRDGLYFCRYYIYNNKRYDISKPNNHKRFEQLCDMISTAYGIGLYMIDWRQP